MICQVTIIFSSVEVNARVEEKHRKYEHYFEFDFSVIPCVGDIISIDDQVDTDDNFIITLDRLEYPYFKVKKRYIHCINGETKIELYLKQTKE